MDLRRWKLSAVCLVLVLTVTRISAQTDYGQTTQATEFVPTTADSFRTGTTEKVEFVATTEEVEFVQTTEEVEFVATTADSFPTGTTEEVEFVQTTEEVELVQTTADSFPTGTTEKVEFVQTTEEIEFVQTTADSFPTGTTEEVEFVQTTEEVEFVATTADSFPTGTTEEVEFVQTTEELVEFVQTTADSFPTGTTEEVEFVQTTEEVEFVQTTADSFPTGTTEEVEFVQTTEEVEFVQTTADIFPTGTTEKVKLVQTTEEIEFVATTADSFPTGTTEEVEFVQTTADSFPTGTTEGLEFVQTTEAIEFVQTTADIFPTGTTEEVEFVQTTEELVEFVQTTADSFPTGTTEEVEFVQTTEEVEFVATTADSFPTGTTEEVEFVQTTEEIEFVQTTADIFPTGTTEEVEFVQTTEEVGFVATTADVFPTGTTEEVEFVQTTEEVEFVATTADSFPTGTTEEVEFVQTTEEVEFVQTTADSFPTGTTEEVEFVQTTEEVEFVQTTADIFPTGTTEKVELVQTTEEIEFVATTADSFPTGTTEEVEFVQTTADSFPTGTTEGLEFVQTTEAIEFVQTTADIFPTGTTEEVEFVQTTEEVEFVATTADSFPTGTTEVIKFRPTTAGSLLTTEGTESCSSFQLQCSDGECKPRTFFCDRSPGDCADDYDEDETLCCDTLGVESHCSKPDHYRCSDGKYIPNSYLCDGTTYDCLNNEDENDEHCVFCPNPGEPTNGQIVPWYAEYFEGESVTYSCLDGYTLKGNASAVCGNMTFDMDVPLCYENCPTPRTPAQGSSNASSPVVHGDLIGFTCDPGYTPIPDVTIVCNNGTLEGRVPTCQDINECATVPCLNGGGCLNLMNAYQCMCTSAWTGANCSMDVDECLLSADNCHPNATCTNEVGGFNCTCNEGFKGDGVTCIEDYLFPHGGDKGDSLLSGNSAQSTATDKVSNVFKPEYGFPLGYKYFFSGLYFTDNGQIVFTNQNSMPLAYPHPFPDGFGKKDGVAMVAPFWIDANPDAPDAEVFYQVYTNTSGPVMQDACSRIKDVHSSFSSFEPDWMLVVTWYHMPSFIETTNTNTFQVALVTDGDYGFAIVNYEQEGMQWNYNALSDTDVIIGYSNGSGLFVNSQKESPFASVADKFRPDTLVGNTGLTGRWVYRLDLNSARVTNPKRYCRWWYNRQVDPSRWKGYLGTCPCAFSQGDRDSTYKRRRRSSGRNSASSSQMPITDDVQNQIDQEEGGFCLQTQFPQRNYAGMRCCYRADRSLVTGYDGVWELSVTERVQFSLGGRISWFRYYYWVYFDYAPRYYCCEKANDEAFCDMYFEKRPKGRCSGYLPPNTGWMIGDPHITTLDGVGYTFNGLGEYTQFLLPDSEGETLFEIQGRTMRARDAKTGEFSQATLFVGFVGQANDSAKVQMSANENSSDVDIFINDELFNKTLIEEDAYHITNMSCSISQRLDANNNTRYLATWMIGTSMEVGISMGIMDIVVSAPISYMNRSSRGLLGVWNGDPTDDFMKRNETLLTPSGSDGNYTDADYFEFGETWRTTPETSLFLYPPDTGWADYNNLTFVPLFLDELIAEAERDDPTFLAEVRSTCGDNSMCLFDSLATKDTAVGMATMAMDEANVANANELANFPPTIDNGTNVIIAHVGEPVQFQVNASDPNGDAVSFSLLQDVEGASVNQDGLFVWNPTNTSKVRIAIQASDGSANAVLEPTVKVCNCQNNGTCMYDTYVQDTNIMKDKFAVVVCNCTAGWTGDFCEVDFNACQDNPCFENVTCIDLPPPEVTNTCGPCPDNLQGNGFTCYDLDECNLPGGSPCSQLCANFLGGYNCTCNSGYDLHQDMHNCTDVDECMQANVTDCHAAALCNNTAGSYECYCPEGYNDVNDDGTICEDINECLAMPPVCTAEMECQNTVGSYVCNCEPGYEGVNGSCVDVDECARNTSDCGQYATCRNVPGQFVCRCDAGFQGDGYNCTNMNECEGGMSRCSTRATCQDTVGSYLCLCVPGYVGDGSTCEDINECNTTMNNCSEVGSMCMNSAGSYTCRCIAGYRGDGFTCTEILITTTEATPVAETATEEVGMATQDTADESVTMAAGITRADETATEEVGMATQDTADESVTMAAGITRADETATEEVGMATQGTADESVTMAAGITRADETATEEVGMATQDTADESVTMAAGITRADETATEEVGMATQDTADESVTMAAGITRADETATEEVGMATQDTAEMTTGEVDMCSLHCAGNSTCENTAGSVVCTCNAGYQGDGITNCTDIDECAQDPSVCDRNAACTNLPGNFTCDCNAGFQGDGITGCADVDECAQDPPVCHTNATCTNTYGSFACECSEGFFGNGITCSDVNECSLTTPPCAANSDCENIVGSFSCSCSLGYQGDGHTSCTDVDECSLDLSNCHQNATCINTDGSFDCLCSEGFSGDGLMCADIDECVNDPNICTGYGETCFNVHGSYSCVCDALEGFFEVNGTCQLFTSFQGSFVINAINGNATAARYVPALADPNSPEFIALAKLVCDIVSASSESNSALSDNYETCQVVAFTESDQTRRKRAVSGFVLALFAAMFQLNSPVDGSAFQAAMRDTMRRNTSSLSADVSSLDLQATTMMCVDGHCLNGATCSVGITNQIECMCADGFIGSRCEAMGTVEVTDATTPVDGLVVTSIVADDATDRPPDSDVMGLLVIIIVLAGLATLLLLAFMLIICVYLCQKGRASKRTFETRGGRRYFARGSIVRSSDDWHHSATNRGMTDMDRQMQYLVENISQSPYYLEPRRSVVDSSSAAPVRLPVSEFVQPYLASGMEASRPRLGESRVERAPSRSNRRAASTSTNHPQSIRHYWDNQ
ncbi:uncharacterized protein LOC119720211 isoform X2 [Patiria miniata]|uniref:Mucin-like protein n=1 Tax=Patiria miniata TaxID=46514 RepID=A0A913Z1G3_PATMI|nr:uncharacterized protein LOC119720211 isoform X2 [Patiria miniata]